MKKLISRFSDKLLSNQQLRAVKGSGNYYCYGFGTENAAACAAAMGFPTGGPPWGDGLIHYDCQTRDAWGC